jgi:hypothetical protein
MFESPILISAEILAADGAPICRITQIVARNDSQGDAAVKVWHGWFCPIDHCGAPIRSGDTLYLLLPVGDRLSLAVTNVTRTQVHFWAAGDVPTV